MKTRNRPERRGHKPRDSRGPRSWKRQEGAGPCPHLDLRLLASRTGGGQICVGLSCPVCGRLQGSPGHSFRERPGERRGHTGCPERTPWAQAVNAGSALCLHKPLRRCRGRDGSLRAPRSPEAPGTASTLTRGGRLPGGAALRRQARSRRGAVLMSHWSTWPSSRCCVSPASVALPCAPCSRPAPSFPEAGGLWLGPLRQQTPTLLLGGPGTASEPGDPVDFPSGHTSPDLISCPASLRDDRGSRGGR